jgi:uncharacterized protein (TIGR03083 family)
MATSSANRGSRICNPAQPSLAGRCRLKDVADLWAALRNERLALIDLLQTLGPEQWATPSLCRGWTVQDVAAHVAWAPALTPTQALSALLRAGFRPNTFNAQTAARWSRRGPAAILDQLRTNADQGAKPIGVPPPAAVVDAVVHALDIRRPLGQSRAITPEAFQIAADFCAKTRWPGSAMLGGSVQQRIRGIRLVANDYEWSWGQGLDVRGTGETLLLVLTGRPVRRDELDGAGSATLHGRL